MHKSGLNTMIPNLGDNDTKSFGCGRCKNRPPYSVAWPARGFVASSRQRPRARLIEQKHPVCSIEQCRDGRMDGGRAPGEDVPRVPKGNKSLKHPPGNEW